MTRRTLRMTEGRYPPQASITIEEYPNGKWMWATAYTLGMRGKADGFGHRFAESETAAIQAGVDALKQDCARLAEGLDRRSSTNIREIQRWLRDTENSLQQPALFGGLT